MSRLITTSFLDSIAWCKKAPDSKCPDGDTTWKQQAYQQLKDTLGRAPYRPNKAMLRGIEFENQIYSILTDHKEDTVRCSVKFRDILKLCAGGEFQKKTKTILELDGEEYCLYGKLDVRFSDHIVDIKTTAKYAGKQKYLDTSQHHLYCFSENIKDFEYIIAEFEDEDSPKIHNVYRIPYHMGDRDYEEKYIKDKIYEAMAFLNQYDEPGDLKSLYFSTYTRY